MPMSTYVNGIIDLAGKLKAIALMDEEITDVLIFNLDNEYSSIAASLTATKGDLNISEVTLKKKRGKGEVIQSFPCIAIMDHMAKEGHIRIKEKEFWIIGNVSAVVETDICHMIVMP